MILEIGLDAHTPPYRQIQDRIAELVATGALAEGTRLPPVRQLAADLDLAPNTVARAYRELEAGGLVVTRGRRGTFVARHPSVPHGDAARAGDGADALVAAAQVFATEARSLGADPQTAILAVCQALSPEPRPARH